jgi:hypothetical protein
MSLRHGNNLVLEESQAPADDEPLDVQLILDLETLEALAEAARRSRTQRVIVPHVKVCQRLMATTHGAPHFRPTGHQILIVSFKGGEPIPEDPAIVLPSLGEAARILALGR